MIALLVIAAGLWRGSLVLASVGVLLALPVPVVGAGLLLWGAWARAGFRRSQPRPMVADLASGMASELRAGQSVPAALVSASYRVPDLDLHRSRRLIASGRSTGEVAVELENALPDLGRACAAAYRLAAASGARAADVFSRLAVVAEEHEEERREARVHSAQARLSAVVVALAPLVILSVMGIGGLLRPLTRSGSAGAVLIGAGVVPIAAGVMTVWGMSRRALR